MEKNEQIIGMSVPDDDVPGWIQTLHEGGFSTKEIDSILGHLNKEYFNHTLEGKIDQVLKQEIEYLKIQYNRILSPEQIEYLRRGIEMRFKPESPHQQTSQ